MAELDASIHEKVGDLVPDDEVDGELLGINPEIPDDIFLEEHDNEFKPAEMGPLCQRLTFILRRHMTNT